MKKEILPSFIYCYRFYYYSELAFISVFVLILVKKKVCFCSLLMLINVHSPFSNKEK